MLPLLAPSIISLILSQLATPTSPRKHEDLRVASLVCAVWRPIAQALLFSLTTSMVKLRPRTWNDELPRLTLFLQSSLAVASNITSLAIRGIETKSESSNLVPAAMIYKILGLLPTLKRLMLQRITIFVPPGNRPWPSGFALERLELLDIAFAYGTRLQLTGPLDEFLSPFKTTDILIVRPAIPIDPIGAVPDQPAVSEAHGMDDIPREYSASREAIYPIIQHLDVDVPLAGKFVLRYLNSLSLPLPDEHQSSPLPIPALPVACSLRKLRLNLIFRSHWTDALIALQHPAVSQGLEDLELIVHIVPVSVSMFSHELSRSCTVPTIDDAESLYKSLAHLTHLRRLTFIVFPNSSSHSSKLFCTEFVSRMLQSLPNDVTREMEIRLGLPWLTPRRRMNWVSRHDGSGQEIWETLNAGIRKLLGLDEASTTNNAEKEVARPRITWLLLLIGTKRLHHQRTKWLRCWRARETANRAWTMKVVSRYLLDAHRRGLLVFENTVFPECVKAGTLTAYQHKGASYNRDVDK
ncbi:hypothetical protein BC629DRAFT_1733016 [Irpex lacteus]|nr:hypothetical protein BC629DRAFT_1733016 [Irpex lacteus]